MREWVIIGGGIHGVHIAARLIGQAKVPAQRVHIVDPEPLLSRWRTRTRCLGMTHLRSPSVHHLDIDPRGLQKFAGRPKHWEPGLFRAPYRRPALALFDRHCDHVIEKYELRGVHLRARAKRVSLVPGGVEIHSEEGDVLEAERIVLAMGASRQTAWPQWAASGRGRGVSHVFEQGWEARAKRQAWKRVVVVGGGITAGQLALRLANWGGEVLMVSRHPLRARMFDSDPGWLGPKRLSGFHREQNLRKRRAVILEARYRGSMPPEVLRALKRAIARGRVQWFESDVEGVQIGSRPILKTASGASLEADQIMLATGFQTELPGGELVGDLVKSSSLPLASCGYPVVDRSLRWHPRVFTTGPLAELELGPAARNIAGARQAGARIASMYGG